MSPPLSHTQEFVIGFCCVLLFICLHGFCHVLCVNLWRIWDFVQKKSFKDMEFADSKVFLVRDQKQTYIVPWVTESGVDMFYLRIFWIEVKVDCFYQGVDKVHNKMSCFIELVDVICVKTVFTLNHHPGLLEILWEQTSSRFRMVTTAPI